MYKILIADSDIETLDMVEQMLKREGYVSLKARSVRDALHLIEIEPPEMLIINMTLTGKDTSSICRRLRTDPRTSQSPILFLTDQDTTYTVADALNAGGDDFLRKPFAIRELSARIRAHLRRSYSLVEDIPQLRILPDTLTVYVNDREVALTKVEFELLMFLCHSPNQLHSTHDLLTDVWSYPNGAGDTALVRNHIRNLRRKIEDDPERPSIIQSRHGRGYTIRARIEVMSPMMGGAF